MLTKEEKFKIFHSHLCPTCGKLLADALDITPDGSAVISCSNPACTFQLILTPDEWDELYSAMLSGGLGV